MFLLNFNVRERLPENWNAELSKDDVHQVISRLSMSRLFQEQRITSGYSLAANEAESIYEEFEKIFQAEMRQAVSYILENLSSKYIGKHVSTVIELSVKKFHISRRLSLSHMDIAEMKIIEKIRRDLAS